MKKRTLILIVVFLLAIDQISKAIVVANMKLYETISIIPDFFSIYYIRNDGAAFSMLSGRTEFFYLISVLAIGVVIYFYKTSQTKLSLIATSILLSGILGNLIDRLLFKEVIDFLSFKFFDYQFAIFNIADSFITIAVVLYIIDFVIYERRKKSGRN